MKKIVIWVLMVCLILSGTPIEPIITYANETTTEVEEVVLPTLGDRMMIDTYSTSIVDGQNNLWFWGRGYKGADTSIYPEQLYSIGKIKGIVEKNYSVFNKGYIDNEGKIVVWGKNNNGQFGNGETSETEVNFENRYTIPNFSDAKKVILGEGSIALKEDGTVWTWGKRKDTTNPLYESSVIHEITQVEGLENIVDIEMGEWFFLALDKEGNVYSWGWDRYGRLGLSYPDEEYVPHDGSYRYILNPTLIFTNIKKIETEKTLSFAITNDNKLYAWGKDSHTIGEIPYDSSLSWNYTGGSKNYSQKMIPITTEGLENVVDISIGKIHVLALNEEGEIYTWGNNYYGALGNGSQDSNHGFVSEAYKVDVDTKFISVFSEYDTSFALDVEGNLWSWGENSTSQQGNGAFNYAVPSEQKQYYYPRKLNEFNLNSSEIEKNIQLSGLNAKTQLNKRDNTKVDSNSLEADPIDTASGALIINENLLTMNQTNDFGINLHYNSLRIDKNIGFGNGWSFEHNISAERFSSSKVRIQWPSFSSSDYYLIEPETFTYKSTGENGDNYKVTGASGTNATYEIKDKKNIIHKISSGRLARTTFPNQSYISHSYTGGALSSSKFHLKENESSTYEKNNLVSYTYTNGLITRLRDYDNKTVYLEYDENKNLSKITYPNGTTRSYVYNENNQIISGTDSEGIVFMKNEYDDRGRVTKQYDSFDNIITFSYEEDTQKGTISTTVTDREGSIRVLIHDQNYNLIQEVDKEGYITKHEYNDNNNRIKTIYPNETTISMEYDNQNNLIKITDQLSNSVFMEYDSNNNLIKTTNSNGASLINTYDDKNQLISVKDTSGYEITYAYQNGFLISKTEPNEAITTYTYRNGYLFKKTDPMGNVTTYTVDRYGNILTETDPLGNITTYTYDSVNNLSTQKNPLQKIMSMTYDSHNQMLSLVNYKGIMTNYEYDINGNLIKEKTVDRTNTYSYNKENYLTTYVTPKEFTNSTTVDKLGRTTKTVDGNGLVTDFEYDSVGNLVKKTVDGAITTYTYDAANNLIAIKNAEGHITNFEYNSLKQLVKETDSKGNITTHTYDLNGNLTSTTDALGNIVQNEYNANNQILKTTDAKGNVFSYLYNKNNTLIQTTNALGGETHYKYDANGNLIEITNALGHKVQYTYDKLNRLVKTTDPLGHTVRNIYDENSNIIETYDGKENLIYSYEYDSFNNPIKVTNALGHITTNTFDKEDNLIKIVDSLNRSTEYIYDSNGQIISIVDPNSVTSTAEYNSFGEVKGFIDNNTNKTSYLHDKLGQILQEENATGNQLNYTYDSIGNVTSYKNGRGNETTYTYDVVGNIIKTVNPESVVEYSYDKNYNLTETKETITETNKVNMIKREYDELNRLTKYTDQFGNVIQYTYDAIGNLTKLIYPDLKEVNYTYDASGNMLTATDWNGDTTSYIYDVNNLLTETNHSNGTKETRSYDKMGQLLNITHHNSQNEVIQSFDETYDSVGNVVKENNNNYRYDNLNRLIGANDKNYTYDAAGNLLTVSENDVNSLSMSYGLDNQLNTYQEAPTEFDNDGNLLTIPNGETVSRASYDTNNRLITLGQDSYLYNSENQRISVTENGETSQFVISSHNDLDQVLMETDSKGSPTNYYVYGKGLISKEDNDGDKSYYHYDRRGSTVALTNEAGILTDSVEYDIYGEVLEKEGDTQNRFWYNGQYGVQTDASGLYHMRARYYSPEIKRFINRDIVSGSIQSSQTFNRYAYVNGNPVSYIDPFGLSREADSKSNSFLDSLQVGLSVAGFAPVFGEAFDVINAGVSLLRGDYVDAALNLSSAIPVVGNAVAVAKLGKMASKINRKCNCLVSGTKVQTISGEKNIEDIQIGDEVLSKNEETGEIDYKSVTGLFNKTSEELYTIKLGEEEIVATGEHPFWVEGKEWILAEELEIGDFFLSRDGQSVEITDIIKSEEKVAVYNFEVEDFHTYFISDSEIWTHNCNLSPKEKIVGIKQPKWLENSKRYKVVQFKGKTTIDEVEYDISRRVYQLNNLNPNRINPNGKSNLELMKEGLAPYDNNGKMIILHHTIQEEVGPIAELASSTHQKHTKILHGLKTNGESFRNDDILNNQYNNFKSQYWRARATSFE